MAFIKPANHDQAKTRKYKSDIGKRENMPYDAENDAYICHAGYPIQAAYEKKTKSKTGYPLVITVYSCTHCDGCPHKTKCIKEARHRWRSAVRTFMSLRTFRDNVWRWKPGSIPTKAFFYG